MRRHKFKSIKRAAISKQDAVQEVEEEEEDEDEDVDEDEEVEVDDDETRPLNPEARDILQDPDRPSFWRLLTGEPWPERPGVEAADPEGTGEPSSQSPSASAAAAANEKEERRRAAQMEKRKRLESLALGFRKAEKGEELTPQEVLDLRRRSYVRYMCTQLGAELEDSLNRGWIPENTDLQHVMTTILAEGGGGGDDLDDMPEAENVEPEISANPVPPVHRRWKGSSNGEEDGDSSNSNSTSSSNMKGGSPGGLRNRKDNATKKSKSKSSMLRAELKQRELELEERRQQRQAFLKTNIDETYNAKIHQKVWALAGRTDISKRHNSKGKYKDSDDEDEPKDEDSDEDIADWDPIEEEAVGNLIDSMKGDPPTDLWGMDGCVLFIFFFVIVAGSVFTFMYLALYARNYPGWFRQPPADQALPQATATASDVLATFSTVKNVGKHAKHLKKIGSLR